MKFHIQYLLKGPARTVLTDNVPPVVEAASLREVLARLTNLPDGNNDLKIEVIGIKIAQVEEIMEVHR